jgi:hypothetical protein
VLFNDNCADDNMVWKISKTTKHAMDWESGNLDYSPTSANVSDLIHLDLEIY